MAGRADLDGGDAVVGEDDARQGHAHVGEEDDLVIVVAELAHVGLAGGQRVDDVGFVEQAGFLRGVLAELVEEGEVVFSLRPLR